MWRLGVVPGYTVHVWTHPEDPLVVDIRSHCQSALKYTRNQNTCTPKTPTTPPSGQSCSLLLGVRPPCCNRRPCCKGQSWSLSHPPAPPRSHGPAPVAPHQRALEQSPPSPENGVQPGDRGAARTSRKQDRSGLESCTETCGMARPVCSPIVGATNKSPNRRHAPAWGRKIDRTSKSFAEKNV